MTTNRPPSPCLVTGGGGFIGSHLVECLLDRGSHVVVLDDYSTGRRSNLQARHGAKLEIIEGTVSETVGHLGAGAFEEIYHLAAAVGVRLVIDEPIRTVETNIEETGRILRYAASSRTPLLLASTSEVYGKGTRMPFAEDDDVVYGPTTLHRWSYACSKAIDEYLTLAYGREYDLPVVIARFFNTVGPRQVGTWGMVLPRFVEAARTGTPLELHGTGMQTRCFCDVRDIAAIVPVMLGTESCRGRVVNVGHDESITMRELAELVIKTLESDSVIQSVPYDQAFGAGFDDLRDRIPDLQRLRGMTGFRPRITLEQTIRDLAASMEAEERSAARP